MKWFKHFSDALDDPFIQELIDKFSHSGYVAWFGLLEIISKENGNILTGKLSIDPKYLKRKMHISVRKLEEIFEFCSRKPKEKSEKSQRKVKLFFNKTLENWEFYIPKMLELKDNYTKDLQATGKKPSNHKEEEVEEEVEEDNKYSDKIKQVVDYLNKVLGTKFKYKSSKTVSCITARLNEGYTGNDFQTVIDKKYNEWINTDSAKYLRPETLFGNKFDGYLNQIEDNTKTQDDGRERALREIEATQQILNGRT